MIYQFKANKKYHLEIFVDNPRKWIFLNYSQHLKREYHIVNVKSLRPFFSTFGQVLPHLTWSDQVWWKSDPVTKIAVVLKGGFPSFKQTGMGSDGKQMLKYLQPKLWYIYDLPKSALQKLSKMFSAVRCWSQGLLEQPFPEKCFLYI